MRNLPYMAWTHVYFSVVLFLSPSLNRLQIPWGLSLCLLISTVLLFLTHWKKKNPLKFNVILLVTPHFLLTCLGLFPAVSLLLEKEIKVWDRRVIYTNLSPASSSFPPQAICVRNQDRKKQAFTDKLGHQHFFCPWEHTGLVTNLQMTVASYRNSKISLKNQFSSRHSSTGEGEAGSKTLKEKKKKTVPWKYRTDTKD